MPRLFVGIVGVDGIADDIRRMGEVEPQVRNAESQFAQQIVREVICPYQQAIYRIYHEMPKM